MQSNLFSLSVTLGLPRIAGSPEEVAADMHRRALAKLNNAVYVGAYLRRRPRRRTTVTTRNRKSN